MITNARLVSVAPPPVNDGNGGYAAPAPTALSGVRCAVDAPSEAQHIAAAGKVSGVSDVLYVPMAALGHVAPQAGGQVVYQLDGQAQATRRVARCYPRVKDGGLSHFELWLTH